MNASFSTDICIVGAGPGGCTAALQLAKQGYGCLLVDKATFPRDKVCGDALSGKVVEVLRKVEPDIIDRLALQPMQLGSWGVNFTAPNGKVLRVPFKRHYNKHQEQAPGFIVKRIDFDHFLLEQTLQHPVVTFRPGISISHHQYTDDGILLKGSKGEQIQARLVIVADGAQSKLAKALGNIHKEPKHYCAGIRAYYKGVQGMDADNFIELQFLKELLPGYFWIFPLPNGMANVGLGMRSDKVSSRKANLKQLLDEVLTTYAPLQKRFKHAERVGGVKGFGLPLGSKKRSISGDRFLLVGDAASLIDPFTGEGIGNAMMSGMMAADQAISSLQQTAFNATFMRAYDTRVYARLWDELLLSRRMQQLVNYPWLFNLVVNKANRNQTLQETISCMFEDMDLRDRLRKPSFYLNLLVN